MTNLTKNSMRYLTIILALSLTACDGGIFGTGGEDMLNSSIDLGAPNPEETASSAPPATDNSNEGIPTDSDIEAGPSDVSNSEAPTSNPVSGDVLESINASLTSNLGFSNSRETLASTDAMLNMINTTNLALNVVDDSSQPAMLFFDGNGVEANTVSGLVSLPQNTISFQVVDSTNTTEYLYSFVDFTAVNSSLTTLLARESATQFDVIPLSTRVESTDPSLASVRLVQAATLNNGMQQATFSLQSAGGNPGGIDTTFGPLSFDQPVSEYTEVPAGDYELIDPLNRIETQAISFEGGMVYTVVIVDDAGGPLLIVNDTQ